VGTFLTPIISLKNKIKDMKTYKVYFEIFGKKMKVEIKAKSKQQAEEIIKSKIIFHKIENVSMPDFLKDIFKF
jgi:hypothetical protein